MTQRVAWRAAARDTLRVGGWGMAVYLGVVALSVVFHQRASGALGAQFVLAEFGLGKLGVAWSDPAAPPPTNRDLARRILGGARFGVTAAAVMIVIGLVTREVTREATAPSIVAALIGGLVAAATAARDELLLRGLPLRALALTRSNLGVRGDALALVAIGALSAAARWGAGGAGLEVGVAACAGVALGSLWLRDRGAWMAFGANLAFTWVTGPLVRGGLADLRGAGASADVTATPIALGVSLVFAALGAAAALRPRAR